MAEDVRDPRWGIEFAPRVGCGARGRLRAVAQTPPPADRIFGLFTESLEYQYQVSCRVCELRVDGDNSDSGLMYAWESVPPRCFCGRPMDWVVRGPNQPPLLCHRRGSSCVADRMWQSHAWRCVCPGCAHGYQEICRGCVPGPLCEDEPCSVDNQHFGFEATADKCTYSMAVAGGKLWIFVGDSCLHDNEVVWMFDPHTVAVERVPLPSHPEDSITCRRVVNACGMPDGRRIYFEASSSVSEPLVGVLDSVTRSFEPWGQPSPGAFRGRFVLAGGATVGMTDEGLHALSRSGAQGWEPGTRLSLAQPCMPALGPVDGTVVVFGGDGDCDAQGASLVRPQLVVQVGPAGGDDGPGPLRQLRSPVAVPSLASGGCALLPQVLRYGDGAMGYLLFSLEGDVFRYRDEDILLPEQLWQPPQWDLGGADPGLVTFSFAGSGHPEMRAHIYVLRRYQYFRGLLAGWAEGQTRTVSVEDVEPAIFGRLLDFAYTGVLDSQLSMTALAALLSAANKYLIADLAVAALRRLQRALRSRAAVAAASSEALAQVLGTAEEVGPEGAALLQDATEALLLHRPELLEEEAFLVPLARGSPAALRAVLAAYRACSALSRADVRWRRGGRRGGRARRGMALDEAAARALVAELGEAFVAGLRGLVEAAAAELGARGRALAAEARELAARRRRLEEERGRLEEERGALERERGRPARPPGDGGAGDEAVSLNLGGEARVTVLRSTLTQCEGSMLAAAFSGRWELPKDDLGGVFVNFEPALFLPLVQHLRMRQIEAPDDPTPPPSFDLREQEACFRRMLRYYNLEDWVYRSPLPEEIPYQVHIDDHTYAVLPPQDPEETVAFGDMSSQTVAVPRGWEILQTDAEEFECIITDLASHGWGALRLCCQNPGGGFSSYLTRLHGGGTAGTRWSGDARLIQSVGAPDGRQYRFSPACSARLVIRVRDRPLGGAMSRGEGRRLAAI